MENLMFDCKLHIAVFLIGITMSVKAQSMVETLSKNVLTGDDPGDNTVIMNGNGDSFAKTIQEMDVILQKKAEPCTIFDPPKPLFQVEGRRVSEIKCFEHIWEIKLQEETKNRVGQCQEKYGKQFTGIVGGRTSQPGEYPHMGAVGWKGKKEGKWDFNCGSFLVSDRFVLTAAHCQFDNYQKHPKIIRFGVINILSNDKINPDQPPVDIRILEFIKHPAYRPNFKAFDIAAIKLATRVTFNDFIQPVCILNQNINKAIITGWGYTDENEKKISENLQVAKVDVLPHIECKRRWKAKRDKKYWPKFLKSQMCATKMDGVADICAGDSGGPLQSELYVNTKRSIYNVVGITSHNYNCGGHKFPSVYTKVSEHIAWVEKVVWDVKTETSQALTDEKDSNKANIDHYQIVEPAATEKVVKNPTKERIVKINEVQNYNNGYLFWFDTTKESQWVYIDKSEISKNKHITALMGNALK